MLDTLLVPSYGGRYSTVCRNSLIASSFSVQYFCVFIFVGIFDRELLTPLEVHYNVLYEGHLHWLNH
jgi:hypothetical protein